VLGYRWYEPDNMFRRKNIYFAYNRNSDYENNISRSGFYGTGSVQFLNFWGVGINGGYNFESTSTTLTRGGPIVIMPQNYSINIHTYTDSREKIIFSPSGGFWRDDVGGHDYYYRLELEWKPSPQVGLIVGPEYNFNHAKFQWVDNIEDEYATETYNTRYVFGELSQQTISANIRLNWIFSPTLSLQLYMQPLFAIGDYTTYKELARPSSMDYNIYGENGFSNPDFNFKSLRGNVVLRWEYFPGSVFYFVWSHNKVNNENPGDFSLSRDVGNLWNSAADNVLLIKFSYWLDI
jgi:hypothetical protein